MTSNGLRDFKDDLEFGLSKEEPTLIKLINHFKRDIQNTKTIYNDKFCKWDYETIDDNDENKNIKFELKSRKTDKDAYKTTIFPVHKTINFNNCNGTLICVFCFSDKLCYIKYDKNLFNKFSKMTIQNNRTGRNDNPVVYYNIPVDLLIDLNE